MIWWKVVLSCPGHPFQPESHARYVQATSGEVAARRAIAEFRAVYHLHGYEEVLSVQSVAESPELPVVDKQQLRDLRRQVRAARRKADSPRKGREIGNV